jgi:hypothetical protein
MAKDSREFSEEEIQNFHRWWAEGVPNGEIASRLGMPYSSLHWYRREGVFGDNVPSRQGKGHKQRNDDSEEEQRLFGSTGWQIRQVEVRESWDDRERIRRAHQQLPNGESLYEKFHNRGIARDSSRNNPNH